MCGKTVNSRRRVVILTLVIPFLVHYMPQYSLGYSGSPPHSLPILNVSCSVKHTVYGSLLLLAVGGTLLWVCHLIQYRAIYRHLMLYFTAIVYEGGNRVLSAGLVPYIDSYVGMFSVGMVFVCLGFGGMVWTVKDSKYLKCVILFAVGVLLQIPQFIILHASVSNSSSPKTAIIAQCVGVSFGIAGVVLVTWSLVKFCPRSHFPLLSIFSRCLFIVSNVMTTVSFVCICTCSNSKHGFGVYISSYPMLAMSVIIGVFVFSRSILSAEDEVLLR